MVTPSSPLASTIERLGLTRDQAATLFGVARSALQRWLARPATAPRLLPHLLHLIDEGRNRERVQELARFVNPFFAASIATLEPKQRKVKDSDRTNAERQRRYRERQKQARAASPAPEPATTAQP